MKNIFLFLAVFVCNSALTQVSDFKSTDFTIADNRAKLFKGAPLDNLPLLAHRLTFNLRTDVEKFRAIYSWVCTNVKGDVNQHQKVTRKRKKLRNDSIGYYKWNNQYKITAFKKLFKDKKTMCTGYAYLIKELCFFADINCKIIDGYGRSVSTNVEKLDLVNHSWNAVKLNSKWYLCDATWSSGYMAADAIFINDYNDGYFLTEPSLFAQNHYPIDKKWLLNDALIKSEFVATPLVYGETFRHKVVPMSPEKMDIIVRKDEEINFSIKSLKDNSKKKVTLMHFAGNDESNFKIYDLKNENKSITFKYKFKRKGFYDVHIKIANDVVATYTIEVVKS